MGLINIGKHQKWHLKGVLLEVFSLEDGPSWCCKWSGLVAQGMEINPFLAGMGNLKQTSTEFSD